MIHLIHGTGYSITVRFAESSYSKIREISNCLNTNTPFALTTNEDNDIKIYIPELLCAVDWTGLTMYFNDRHQMINDLAISAMMYNNCVPSEMQAVANNKMIER